MILTCPMCGTWEGPAHGDGLPVDRLCAECIERGECEECMDEQSVRTADTVFVPPFDAEYEGEVEPDFDDLDD